MSLMLEVAQNLTLETKYALASVFYDFCYRHCFPEGIYVRTIIYTCRPELWRDNVGGVLVFSNFLVPRTPLESLLAMQAFYYALIGEMTPTLQWCILETPSVPYPYYAPWDVHVILSMDPIDWQIFRAQ